MVTQEIPRNAADTTWIEMDAVAPRRPPRRVRGLRMPVLPTGALIAQIGGAVAVLVGCYLQFGIPRTLIIGGVAAVILGALREAGKV